MILSVSLASTSFKAGGSVEELFTTAHKFVIVLFGLRLNLCCSCTEGGATSATLIRSLVFAGCFAFSPVFFPLLRLTYA
jgi:3-methyladenine DNA glycosylase Mpg